MADSQNNEVLERLVRLETKIDSLCSEVNSINSISHATETKTINLENKVQNLEQDVRELRDHNTWLTRTTWAAIISSVFAIVVALIKVGIGV